MGLEVIREYHQHIIKCYVNLVGIPFMVDF